MAQEQNPEEQHIKWYDEDQPRTLPDMPYHIDKRLMSIL